MAILSTNQRLINVGDSYSAGNGIDITNNIISVTGDNAPYSAGDNIDIQDHIISGKDWSNDIENASANAYNVTTAWVQDNYANSADMTYISAMVDTKLDTSAWSSVSGDLATESYVIMADNITYDRAKGYVDSKGFATEEFVNENTSGKLDSSSFASVSSDFLTTAFGISESGAWNEATNCVENNSAAWFDNQGDIEVNELVYAQSANWNEISSKLDSTAFDTWQQGQYTNDIAGLNNLIGTKLDASSFEETSGTFYPTSNPSGFITGVDLSNYYTKDETSGKEELANAFANIPVGDPEVNAYVTSNSASIDESTNLVQSNSSTWNDVTAYQSNSANYLTAINIPESATWNDVSETVQTNSAQWSQGGTTYTSPSGTILINGDTLEGTNSAISIVGYEGFVSSYGLRPVGPNDTARYTWDKAVPNTIITLDTWATRYTLYWSANTDLTGEIVLPEAGRTTQSISIPNATAFAAWSDNFFNINSVIVSAADTLGTTVGELAWASALPSYEYDDTNKISAINGSALAGGDMFTAYLEYNDQNQISSYAGSAFAGQGGAGNPEVENYVQTNSANIDETVTSYQTNSGTFLTEPNLEYNAVGEISGYGNSAIAQYGAEKQWLQHDDTIVHVANSAQYAFGCNISALQRLMGIDETVLFDGNLTGNNATAQLSESIYNFEKIKVYGHTDDGIQYPWFTEAYTSGTSGLIGVATNNVGWSKWFAIRVIGNTLTNLSGKAHTWAATSWSNLSTWGTTRVIGIHRISG